MIDILLATYNGEKYLEEQIVSLFLQTNQKFKIIARDDGSTDGTVKILEKYHERYKDRFLLLTGNPTGSAKSNFFELLDHSTAEYSAFCDQDDIWSNQKLERTLGCLQDAEEEYGKEKPLLVHSDLAVADENLKITNRSLMRMQKLNPSYHTLNRLLSQNNVTGCALLMNCALRQKVQANKAALMHDWWIALTAAAFGQILYYPSPTVVYRQHGRNSVGAKNVADREYLKDKLNDKAGIRASIQATYSQAKAFLDVHMAELSSENKTKLQEYVQLGSCGMMHRFVKLQRYHFFKSGLYRKIAQIVYG